LCQPCTREEEDNYTLVFRYLSTRPAATAQEIAQETGVDIKEIYRYVRENRLRLVKNDTGLFCEGCGIAISQGKMCEKCFQKLASEIQDDIVKAKEHLKDSPKTSPKSPPRKLKKDPKYLKNYRGE
jgi:hypothetical protein